MKLIRILLKWKHKCKKKNAILTVILRKQSYSQHEIMNLRLFMFCVKIRKYETFSIRSNSAMRNGP